MKIYTVPVLEGPNLVEDAPRYRVVVAFIQSPLHDEDDIVHERRDLHAGVPSEVSRVRRHVLELQLLWRLRAD